MPPDEQLRDTELLRISSTARPVGVDRKNNILLGYVVAQEGPFKSQGRGEFDSASLQMLLDLAAGQKQGVKSRFTHPTECNDGLGKYLGRSRNWYLGEAINALGVKVQAVRADLHFDKTALDTPPDGGKPLGLYVMDLAESDPDALSSSVVIRTKMELRLNPDGTKKKDDKGEDLPPLWRPYKLWATDVVDTGDAVDGLLSADGLPNAVLWKGAEMLNGMFEGLSRGELSQRLRGWLDRYLDERFGPDEAGESVSIKPVIIPPDPTLQAAGPDLDMLHRRQRIRELEASSS